MSAEPEQRDCPYAGLSIGSKMKNRKHPAVERLMVFLL